MTEQQYADYAKILRDRLDDFIRGSSLSVGDRR